MVKKLLLGITTACIVIGSIASICFAGYYWYGEGINTVYNGAYESEQAWVDIESQNENFWVKVYVKKNNTLYGFKRTALYAGERDECFSLTVPGTGGECYWYLESMTGYGK